MVLRIACGDKELAKTMQMVFGRVLIGRNSDHFWFLYGSGNNGKTTMLDLIDMILGDYAVIGNPDMFVPSNRTPKEYYYAGWKGKRYITFNETKKEMVSLSEEIIKQTTDAPKLNARHPGGKAFEFTPQFTPFFSVNHLPAVSNDEAVWRRIKIIPFNYSIPKNLKNGGFKERMFRDNGSGILNWLIEGARMYIENGNNMYICDTVEKFTRLMKQDTDKMGMFLLEFVGEHGTPERILGTDLLTKYSEWSAIRNYKSLGIKNFYVELVAAGLEKKVGRANKTYIYGFAEWSVKNNPAHREKDSADGKRGNITKLVTL